jgi:hypothetical protein
MVPGNSEVVKCRTERGLSDINALQSALSLHRSNVHSDAGQTSSGTVEHLH